QQGQKLDRELLAGSNIAVPGEVGWHGADARQRASGLCRLEGPAARFLLICGRSVAEGRMTHPNDFDRRRFLTAAGSAACSFLAPISSPCAIAASASSPASFGRAKSAVVLYLYGAPSQLDTLDPKPGAPT